MNWKEKLRTSESRALLDQRGMTLVEIMIVVTIMASIMGVVGFFVFGALEEANIKEAKIEVSNLGNMVESYYLMTDPHQLPDSLDDLSEKKNLVKGGEIPTDPWGNEYVYCKEGGQQYTILSKGPDGTEGTEDDIVSKSGGNQGDS